MEACGILLRIFLAIFLGICVFSCSCCNAASACPVRAVRQVTPEGVKCVCMDAFYGDKCQFRGHNSLVINATWAGANDAQVVWEADGVELFKLFTRKVKYDVFGLPIYGKWRAGVQLHALNDADHNEVRDEVKGDHEDSFMEEAGVHLYLDQAFSSEIRVIVNDDDKNKSAAIFIDPPMARALALENNVNGSMTNNRSEEDNCPWYHCPEQAFGFIEFFDNPSVQKGLIIGVTIGMVGTVMISILTYIAIGLCARRCCFKKQKVNLLPSSGTSGGERNPYPCPSTTVDIHEMNNVQEKSNNFSQQREEDCLSVKSLFIQLPEEIEVVPKSASVLW